MYSWIRLFYNFLKICLFFNLFQILSTETKLSDIKGRELPAVDLFSHVIEYFKNHL